MAFAFRRLLSVSTLIFFASLAVVAQTETVYVTRTGTKYHRASCRSLAKSSIPISLSEAAGRYGPCSICRPPLPGASSTPAATASERS